MSTPNQTTPAAQQVEGQQAIPTTTPVSAEKHNELYKAVHGLAHVVEHLFKHQNKLADQKDHEAAKTNLDTAKAALANAAPEK